MGRGDFSKIRRVLWRKSPSGRTGVSPVLFRTAETAVLLGRETKVSPTHFNLFLCFSLRSLRLCGEINKEEL